MKKRDPRKNIVLIIFIVLAVLVGISIVLDKMEKGREAPPQAQQKTRSPRPVTRIVKEYPLPRHLIKGCLFDLGVSRGDVRFQGDTVKVSVHSLPSREQISNAFGPLGGIGGFSIEDDTHVRIRMNQSEWLVIFSLVTEKVARCAIIVDDMGQSIEDARTLGRIDADLTFAVLPDLHDSEEVAGYLHAKGREVLLHLPMQGNGKDPGPGAILEGMSPDQVSSIVKENLRKVPYRVGVNNHMGSLITTSPEDMRLVFSRLKEEGLFFVDSLTTSRSVCGTLAQEYQVPFIARDVFLDNELTPSAISAQINKLVQISLKHTNAVAICHPHPETIRVLAQELPGLKRRGVEIVKVSALMVGPAAPQ